ncbi:MAG: NfeD family protein [Taibaiella sp.]|nr:NfeD family protein [Taibaiella sp.]
METIFNNTVIWFIIGFVLFILEFALPGFILFFFAVGAWIVAATTIFLDIALSTQLAIFIGASLISVILFRKWIKNHLGMKGTPGSALEDEFIGKTAIAQTPIGPGDAGKVVFKGTIWDAESDDTIVADEHVLITGYHSIILIVKSNKKS